MDITLERYHGLGNDYLVYDPNKNELELNEENVKMLCNRNMGLGADGILEGPLMEEKQMAVRIWNPNGSIAEKSGNGVRIFAKYLKDAGYVQKKHYTMLTDGGEVEITYLNEEGSRLKVSMGKLSFWSDEIPVIGERRQVINEDMVFGRTLYPATCVSIGNPHCVIPMQEISEPLVCKIGRESERARYFPNHINTELMNVIDMNNIAIETYESKGKAGYGKDAIRQELKENDSASLVKVGTWECAYSKEMFQEEGTYYTSHLWITGVDDIAFECSFTVPKGGVVKEAEDVIATLEVRKEGQKYPAELIPVRLSEIYLINEGYEWVVSTVKQELKKDFQGIEEDLEKLQQVIDSGKIGSKKKEEWLAIGITVCAILANEVDGMEWKTLIDGNREAPVLQYKDRTIDPMKLVWSKVKAGEPCNVIEEYKKCLD